MKHFAALIVASLLLSILACNLFTPSKDDAAPQIIADTFFFGHAYVDSDGDGQLDAEDAPLPGALFSAAGFAPARTRAASPRSSSPAAMMEQSRPAWPHPRKAPTL